MSIMPVQHSTLVSVQEAAGIIGVTPGRICQLLRANELHGEKLNARAWIIRRKDAERFAKVPQKTGRPRNGC